MMDVTQTTRGAQGAATPPTVAAANDAAVITSDFETFLKMLTTQLENQDPLNPVESTDYAVQLATFSGVEQQVLTNELLESLAGQIAMQGMVDLAGWVGMEAQVAAPVWFEDQPVTLNLTPASGADEAYLLVRDAGGTVRDRIAVGVVDQSVQWAGVDATGTAFPPGQYEFQLQSLSQGTILATDTVPAYGTVAEARIEGWQTILVLVGGTEVPAQDVTALRAPRS